MNNMYTVLAGAYNRKQPVIYLGTRWNIVNRESKPDLGGTDHHFHLVQVSPAPEIDQVNMIISIREHATQEV